MKSALARAAHKLFTRKRARMDEVIREHANLLRNDIIAGWPVDTGASRAGWQGPIRMAEGHYRLENHYPYAATIEYGGYPGTGPKTARQGAEALPFNIDINAGIYPKQRPSAPVRRAMARMIPELRAALRKA